MIPGRLHFHKRKFFTTSNGKNFVTAGLGTQQDYFDEIDEFVHFPPVFTTALLSYGLMEKARSEGYGFEADPVVYTSHQISVDRRLQRGLRSNDRLYQVFGVLDRYAILFRARVQMATLHTMLAVRG